MAELSRATHLVGPGFDAPAFPRRVDELGSVAQAQIHRASFTERAFEHAPKPETFDAFEQERARSFLAGRRESAGHELEQIAETRVALRRLGRQAAVHGADQNIGRVLFDQCIAERLAVGVLIAERRRRLQ